MSGLPPDLAHLAPLLPEPRVGAVSAIEPIARGLSGARVYAVTSSRGPLILRVQPERADPGLWAQQLVILRRAAERGVAPAIVHVDEAARAIVSARVAGMPLAAALGDPAQRGAMIASIVSQLRALHSLDATGIVERDPLAHAHDKHAAERQRPGFPVWADAVEPALAAIEAALAPDRRRAVSHNDVNPGNILWDGERAWLVDWEVAGLNHPFYDLATLAMFLQLSGEVAHALLAQQEQRPVDDADRATFDALRRLAALLCGLMFLSLVPDLTSLPETAPTLGEVYAGFHTGAHDLQTPRGQGAFALALLRCGLDRA